MKRWLGAFGQFFADFILFFILIIAIAITGSLPKGAGLADILVTALAQGLRLFPIAIIAALAFGFHAFLISGSHRIVAWLSIILLGFCCMAGGMYLRRIAPLTQETPRPATAAVGRIMEEPESSTYISALEGNKARGLVRFTPGAKGAPRLQIQEHGSYSSSRQGAASASSDLDKTARQGIALLDKRLGEVDRLSLPGAALVVLGFIILAAGFISLSVLPRWPLVGFFFALAGFFALFGLDAALDTPILSDLINLTSSRFGGRSMNATWLNAGIEGGLGLVLGLAACLSPKREDR